MGIVLLMTLPLHFRKSRRIFLQAYSKIEMEEECNSQKFILYRLILQLYFDISQS